MDEDKHTALAPSEDRPLANTATVVFSEPNRAKITNALSHLDEKYFIAGLASAFRSNPKLQQCTADSVMYSVLMAAQLGLSLLPEAGQFYLIPYRDKNKGMVCTPIVGYLGMCQVAYRSGKVEHISATCVYEHDHFRHIEGLHPTIEHVPVDGDRGKLTHVYAWAALKGTDIRPFVVLSKSDIEKRRKRSRSGDSTMSPWASDYESMAMKSAIRTLYKRLPQSTSMEIASSRGDDSGAVIDTEFEVCT